METDWQPIILLAIGWLIIALGVAIGFGWIAGNQDHDSDDAEALNRQSEAKQYKKMLRKKSDGKFR